MRYWIAFLLFAFIFEAEAGIQHTSYSIEEDGPKSAYRPDPLDIAESASLKQEDVEDAPNTVINASEVAGPPGGGLLRIDPKLVKPKDPAPTWWERCCKWVANFF